MTDRPVTGGTDAARSTIVVTARDANRTTFATVTRIIKNTPDSRRLVVVDGGSSRIEAARLRKFSQSADFTLLRSDAVLSGNEARNAALRHVDTEFTIFVENDVSVDPGWLEGLENCADETGAALVAPAVLWGPGDDHLIHFAGGRSQFLETENGLFFDEHNDHHHDPVGDLSKMSRHQTQYVEMHCLLARTEEVRAVGGFDEALLAARDKSDLTLRIAQRGGVAWLEPSVAVWYGFPKRPLGRDLLFYKARWSDEWNRRSFEHFNRIWEVTDTGIDHAYAMLPPSRRLGWRYRNLSGWAHKRFWLGRRVKLEIDKRLAPIALRYVEAKRAKAGPVGTVHRASWDTRVLTPDSDDVVLT
jgi:GT2 family glycosyltransferase